MITKNYVQCYVQLLFKKVETLNSRWYSSAQFYYFHPEFNAELKKKLLHIIANVVGFQIILS